MPGTHLPKVQKGQRPSARHTNTLISALESAAIHSLGAGLEMRKGAGGTAIALTKQLRHSPTKQPNGADTLVLDNTNPAVTWDREVDDCPVSYAGSWVEFNTTTHIFVQHYRVVTYDSLGCLLSIGAEQTTDIVQAEACA